MSTRSNGPVNRPALIALCLFYLAVALGVFTAATAHAAQYKVVLCAANNGANSYGFSTNTTSPQNPGGIFNVENYCGPAPDPAGNAAFLRIDENQPSGNAGDGAYGNLYYDTPPFVHFKAGGAYTRQFNSFNEGWRARFWVASACCTAQIMTQGTGLPNSEGQWASTGTFSPHLWPLNVYYDFTRFVYEMECVRPAGCDRSNFNATDANTFVFVLEDDQNSQVALTNGSPLMTGQWVRGAQAATFNWTEHGSGIRFERIRIDGAERWSIDHQATGECNTGSSQANGEFARVFQPCPNADNIGRAYTFDTASLADGAHTLQACTQDYGQWQGLNGTGGETCDQRTIHVDNTAPGAPNSLHVTSDNPQRYLDRFGANFSLPPNAGSPITKVHYDVIDAAGKAVVSEKVLSGTNPTELANIEGPKDPGAYQLRVWLEDEVGFVGPAAVAPIPHDTTPPAAPQDLSVTAPTTSRTAQGFDLRWRNIVDAGSPITTAHYQVLDGAGNVVVEPQAISGENPQAIEDLDTPRGSGNYTLQLWLSDAEGNVGAPVQAPLAYDCVRSEVSGGLTLSAGLGKDGDSPAVVGEGEGSMLTGSLRGPSGQTAGAPLCVFSNVVTDPDRQFLGLAMTSQGGDYQFAIGPGPSRDISVVYRLDQRELSARATLQTRVHPSFKLDNAVTHNKSFAFFSGAIPGPHNDKVVVVLQVKSGKGWRVFRRYRTREGGRFLMRYRFTQTATPTTYIMRAQVRETTGYPYLQGNSRSLPLRVLP
ncbi:MAG TPA: hypothetical protein VII45_13510 [Solirubrobacterales bacterium]